MLWSNSRNTIQLLEFSNNIAVYIAHHDTAIAVEMVRIREKKIERRINVVCACVCVCACSITKNKSSSVDAARGVHVQMYIVHNADTLARSLKCMYVFEFLPPQMHTNTRVCVRLRCWKIFVSNEYQ